MNVSFDAAPDEVRETIAREASRLKPVRPGEMAIRDVTVKSCAKARTLVSVGYYSDYPPPPDPT